MKRILIVMLIAVIIIPSCSKKNTIDARITAYAGKVTVNAATIAGNSVSIHFGDRIETGDASFCEITVNQKNIFRLGKNGSLVFAISAEKNTLLLDRGWLAGISRKIFTSQQKYLVQTPTVTASVRGTSFCTVVEKAASTYFCVCNGTIELASEASRSGELVAAAHHTARRFVKGTDGTVTIDANPGLLYHDDAGVETLAKKINESIDWKKPDEK